VTGREGVEAALAGLRRWGFSDAEVYVKSGRSRRLLRGGAGAEYQIVGEDGWAIRAGDRRSSFFLAGTGSPEPEGPWPSTAGMALQLPDPAPVLRWSEPKELDAPLLTELESHTLLDAIAAALAEEAPGARITEALLEDGGSESSLASSRGVRAHWRHRAAALRIEAVLPDRGVAATLETTVRDAKRLQPRLLARALGDRLAVRARGTALGDESGDVVLAPAVAARLLATLVPLLVGPEARERVAPLLDAEGRLGSPALGIVDDGRLPGGLFAAAVDGEGVPTRSLPLVEGGLWRQPLVAWWQARGTGMVSSGCSQRPGYRDPPRPGPSHLFVRPQEGVRAAALVGDLGRGFYLLDVDGAPRLDLAAGRFALPVCGFVIASGAASGPFARSVLHGSLTALLRGIVGVARDVAFVPAAGGLVGSPTLRIAGLALGGLG
jgi:predicted Zn-dependent protease